MKKSVAVIISGFGGNLQALIEACEKPGYPAKIDLVISNKADAYGLVRATKHGIKNLVVSHKDFPTREAFDEKLHQILIENNIEIVCLAGFMRLLTPEFVNKWQGRMLNIHPSLLPAFKGSNAIDDAFNYGVKFTGCTVHHVIPEMDAGPIITQRVVEILKSDTIESLEQKVHVEEKIAYPKALKIVCLGLESD
jgi:phosphoribosylglycinamide formyltransferase-1